MRMRWGVGAERAAPPLAVPSRLGYGRWAGITACPEDRRAGTAPAGHASPRAPTISFVRSLARFRATNSREQGAQDFFRFD